MKNYQFRPFHGSKNKHGSDLSEICANHRFWLICGTSRGQKRGQNVSKFGNFCCVLSASKLISTKHTNLGFCRKSKFALCLPWTHCAPPKNQSGQPPPYREQFLDSWKICPFWRHFLNSEFLCRQWSSFYCVV